MPKRAVGRPTDYKPEYCQGVIEFGRKGKFHFEFANSIGKHVSVIYAWGTKHEEFQDALKEAKQLCEEYWLNTGRALIASSPKSHDSKPWWYIMNNLHGWGDKQKIELTGKDGEALTVQLSAETIKELNEKARSENKRSTGRSSD
jgi:hypothetical protein